MSGSNIYHTNSGNVGVGTNTPAFILDVNGRSRIRGDTGGDTAGIWYSNGTTNPGFIGLLDDNTVGMYGSAGAGWQLQMSTVNGNVGIGARLFPTPSCECMEPPA